MLFAPASIVRAQDNALKGLSDEYSALESQGLTENINRKFAFIILQEYLPSGTRMTSGYRSPEKQLDLIRRMAQAKGIPTPSQMSINDQSSWIGPLQGLRARGIIIASPLTTPHSTPEMVFDLAGASLTEIESGVRSAEKAGMVKIRRTIHEVQNGAIHVELESITGKGMTVLGKKAASAGSTSSTTTTTSTPDSTNVGNANPQQNTTQTSDTKSQNGITEQLKSLHDSETDPSKKIDYDRSIIQLLDSTKDSDKIAALNAEIEQHNNELAQLGQSDEKKQLLGKISAALRDHRFDDAETKAIELSDKFPEEKAKSKNLLKDIKTRRLFSEASDLYDEGGCSKCAEANDLIEQVLEIAPKNVNAQNLKADIAESLQACQNKRLLFIALIAILFIAFVAGFGCWVYFAKPFAFQNKTAETKPNAVSNPDKSSPKGTQWILEGTGGFATGETFAFKDFDKDEIVIGSQTGADITICDDDKKISRRHCTIFHDGNRFYIMDESTNGTKINDETLTRGEMTEIFQNDEISLADKAFFRLIRG